MWIQSDQIQFKQVDNFDDEPMSNHWVYFAFQRIYCQCDTATKPPHRLRFYNIRSHCENMPVLTENARCFFFCILLWESSGFFLLKNMGKVFFPFNFSYIYKIHFCQCVCVCTVLHLLNGWKLYMCHRLLNWNVKHMSVQKWIAYNISVCLVEIMNI